jgi:protein involved in polysaccharide export with SLBB domain
MKFSLPITFRARLAWPAMWLALFVACSWSFAQTSAPKAGAVSGTNPPRSSPFTPPGSAVLLAQPGTNLLTAASTNGMDALDDKHRLAIGDRLSFRIVEDEEDPKQLFVTDSGDLEVPYIGRFPAEGKSCKDLARALKAELEKEYYYQATVILAVDVMAKSRGKVYLVGPVRAPGPQEIPSDEILTLSKAILRAGGFSDFADRTNVRITRKKGTAEAPEQIFFVNVALIFEKGLTGLDMALEAGDFIYVPERSIRF